MNLRKIMEEFLSAGDLSPAAWQKKMRVSAGPEIRSEIIAARTGLKKMGVAELSDSEVDLSVAKVLKGSDDIRASLVEAYQSAARERDSIVASLSIEGFLSDKRLAYTSASLVQHGVDLYTQRAVGKEVDRKGSSFTGRKRFRADVGGRHGSLDGKVVRIGEDFSIGPRRIGKTVLPANKFAWARQNPKDTAEWSNSTSYIEVEKIVDGEPVWVRI